MNTTQHIKICASTPEIRDEIVVAYLISSTPLNDILAALSFDPADVMIQQATGVAILPDWFNECVERAHKILQNN